MPRWLFATTQPPAAGGNGTAGYDLFRRLLRDGHDAHYVNLVGVDPHPRGHDLAGNPSRLPRVWECVMADSRPVAQPALTELLASLNPDVAIGFGFQPAARLKLADPSRRVVLLTGTCRQAQDLVTAGYARDAVSLGDDLDAGRLPPLLLQAGERSAFAICDLIVTHSPLTLAMVERFYPELTGKVYPRPISYAEWIVEGAAAGQAHARPFDDRDIDVLFVASDWSRAEKGYELMPAIVGRLAGLRIHVVGQVPFALTGVTHEGFVSDRDALFRLIGRARSVACPSSMDAAPGVLFEAAALGCNVVASRNCGNWELCAQELLAPTYTAAGFATAIRRAAVAKHQDRLGSFHQQQAYRELVALLTAFSQPFVSEAIA